MEWNIFWEHVEIGKHCSIKSTLFGHAIGSLEPVLG